MLRPALWRLSLRQNSRIFQKVDPLTIINILFLGDEREYCVQYRETDLAFIERLAAEEGLFYYHEFEARHRGAHRLIFADDPQVLASVGERTYHSYTEERHQPTTPVASMARASPFRGELPLSVTFSMP